MISVSDEENHVSATYNLRTTDELFDDQKNVIYPTIRIKRISRPKKNERWEIIVDGNLCLSIKRNVITNKDAEFLYSIDGVRFLLEEFKKGARTVNKLKEALQNRRKQNNG